jgi:ribonuclease HII
MTGREVPGGGAWPSPEGSGGLGGAPGGRGAGRGRSARGGAPARRGRWSGRPSLRAERALAREGFQRIAGVDEVGRGALSGPVTVGMVVPGDRRPPAGLRDSKLLTPAAREALVPRILRWVDGWAVGHAGADEVDRYGILAALRLAAHRALAALAVAPDCLLLDGNFDYISRRYPRRAAAPVMPGEMPLFPLPGAAAPAGGPGAPRRAAAVPGAAVGLLAAGEGPAGLPVGRGFGADRDNGWGGRKAGPAAEGAGAESVAPHGPTPDPVEELWGGAPALPPVRTLIKADMRCTSVAAASILAKITRDGLMSDLAREHPGYGWEENRGYATPTHLDALRALGPSAYHRRSWRLPAPGDLAAEGFEADPFVAEPFEGEGFEGTGLPAAGFDHRFLDGWAAVEAAGGRSAAGWLAGGGSAGAGGPAGREEYG